MPPKLENLNGTQKLISEVALEWLDTLLKKNSDYGNTVFSAPFLAPHLSANAAILVRMSDKISRINNLLKTTTTPLVNESLDDSIADLGAYCLLYLVNKRILQNAVDAAH